MITPTGVFFTRSSKIFDDPRRSRVVWTQKRKNHPKVAFKDSSELELFRIMVTEFYTEQSPKHPTSLASNGTPVQDFSRVDQSPCYHQGALACPTGLEFKRCCRIRRDSCAERGDSANSTNAQRYTQTRIQAQAGVREQA